MKHAIVARRLAADAKSRTAEFVLSTDAIDRMGDVIKQDGWKLDNYLKNPVVLWGHDHDEVIGRMVDIGRKSAGLVGTVQFAAAEQSAFADQVWRMVDGDFIKAGSVGFLPIRYEFVDRGGSYGIDFIEQELTEFSICSVPCNPEAVRVAKALGAGPDLSCIIAGTEIKGFATRDELIAAWKQSGQPARNALVAQMNANRQKVLNF